MTTPECFERLYAKGKEAHEVNRDASAIIFLRAYLKHRPKHPFAWFLLGDSLRAIGALKEAEIALLRSLEEAPTGKRFSIYSRLAMMYADRGDHKKAEAYYAKACRGREGSVLGWLWLLRGVNQCTAGNFKRAERYYRAAMKMREIDIDEVYLNLGYLFRAQFRFQEARRAFAEALRLDPKCSDAKKALRSLRGVDDALAKAKAKSRR